MRILRLEAENVKRLKAVDITPTGPVVTLGGRNGQGKTSVIDAIVYLLGGVAEQCAEPVRRGAESMRIVGHLDDLVVTRVTKAGGGGSLVVTSADGKSKFTSPQAMLDQFVGRLAFDPLEFLRMKAAQQRELLRSLVGLDFSGLDGERKALFDARTDAGRDVHGREQQIGTLVHFPGAPTEEVSVAGLSNELTVAHKIIRENYAIRQRAKNAEENVLRFEHAAACAEQAVTDAERERRRLVEEARHAFEAAEERARNLVAAADAEAKRASKRTADCRKGADAAKTAAAAVADWDVAAIEAKIAEAEKVNSQVRANETRRRFQTQFDEAKAEYDRLDAEIKAIDADKEKQLSAAPFPIEGLSFSESGVSFNGLPFDQASSAEQLRVSVAMGLALNPQLKLVLIRDGSLLDESSRRMVEEMVEQAGGQAWLEVVTTDPKKASVIIEDGEVQAPGQNEEE